MTVYVQAADARPNWVIVRDWYVRLSIELEAIAETGAVRIGERMYFLQDKVRGKKRAARQAARYREAAELIDSSKSYDDIVSRTLT